MSRSTGRERANTCDVTFEAQQSAVPEHTSTSTWRSFFGLLSVEKRFTGRVMSVMSQSHGSVLSDSRSRGRARERREGQTGGSGNGRRESSGGGAEQGS